MSFFSSRGTPYLLAHQSGLLQFRIRVPVDLQRCLGRREYRRSLGRCYHAEAKVRVLRLASAAHEVFLFAREAITARHDSGLTGINQGGTVYTSPHHDREKIIMVQDEKAHQQGYTNEFRGRTLASLTDDEIRAIAEGWLLNALKGANLLTLQLAPEAARAHRLSWVPASELESRQAIEVLENIVPTDKPMPAPSHEEQDARAEQAAATAQGIKAIYERELKSRQFSQATAARTDKALAGHGITITDPTTESRAAYASFPPTPSVPYLQACQEILKAGVTFYDIQTQTARGDYKGHDAEVERLEERQEQRRAKRRIKVDTTIPPASPTPQAVPTETPEAAPVYKLSQALADFKAEQVREGRWDERTRHKENDKYVLFQASIDPEDSLPANGIRADHLRDYKKVLYGIPKNRNKMKAYREIPLPDLLTMAREESIPEADRLNSGTIKVHCDRITTFIKWLARNEYHSNPALVGLLTVTKDKQDHERRSPFTPDDLRNLFDPVLLKAEQKASHFWVPLLGLFTGARLEELCQLHIDDIQAVGSEPAAVPRKVFEPGKTAKAADILREVEENGETLCLYINDGKPFQKIKNQSSRRYVPLSQVLTHELNFMGYASLIFQQAQERQALPGAVESLERGRLFPELRKTDGAGRFSHKLSQWFAEFRKEAGVSEQGKTFHSFRHTIGHFGDSNQLPEKAVGRYLGHSHESITYGTYSTDTAPHILYGLITAPFSEYIRNIIDIPGLASSKWAQHGRK